MKIIYTGGIRVQASYGKVTYHLLKKNRKNCEKRFDIVARLIV